ncbi:MAG: CHAT domain-containing protein, partial [Myxococcales bacterium]|nr:CHAT domain-containing protein [Myxococcales bacterium]
VVPHGPLHDVPFEALPLGDDELVIEHYSVTYAANAATAPLRPLPPPDRARPSLWVADARGDLPGARAEVRDLSRPFSTPTVLTGGAATRTAVLAQLGEAGAVHLAVHGHPARGDDPPHLLLAGGERLTAADLFGQRLDHPLVVLAACDSAVGTPDRSDEMPTVLPRALLLAGAEAVVGTRWPIDDRSAARVMTLLYDALPRVGPEAALATAQRAMLDSAQGDAMIALRNSPPCATNRGLRECVPGERVGFAHPFHWAGFALLGATTNPH